MIFIILQENHHSYRWGVVRSQSWWDYDMVLPMENHHLASISPGFCAHRAAILARAQGVDAVDAVDGAPDHLLNITYHSNDD